MGSERSTPSVGRRVGYLVAALVNVVLVWAASRVDEWFPGLFSGAYGDVLSWVTASLWATVAVNVTWAWRDPPWWRHLGQAGLHAVSILVAQRVWVVFPFDVDDLARLGLRLLIVVWAVGALIGLGVELGKALDLGGSREPGGAYARAGAPPDEPLAARHRGRRRRPPARLRDRPPHRV
jgi:hypothetical protein